MNHTAEERHKTVSLTAVTETDRAERLAKNCRMTAEVIAYRLGEVLVRYAASNVPSTM